MTNKLNIGFLTTLGSPSSFFVLEELISLGYKPDVIYVYRPNLKKNISRFLNKIQRAGIRNAIKRVIEVIILSNKNQKIVQKNDSKAYESYASRVVYVASFNDITTQVVSLNLSFDVFIASTDELLKRKVFSIPEFGTLNAHPAYNPTYRGLDSRSRMIQDGKEPVTTLHVIDEGIDTGPIIHYENQNSTYTSNVEEELIMVSKSQARAFVSGLNYLKRYGKFKFIDSFLEESNMS